jgi:hypothetical protein
MSLERREYAPQRPFKVAFDLLREDGNLPPVSVELLWGKDKCQARTQASKYTILCESYRLG